MKKLGTFLDSLLDRQIQAIVNWGKQPKSDRFWITPEGGYAIRLTNNTGAPSVKGTIVTASSAVDNAVVLQNNEFDAIGPIYEDGIPAGEEVYVVIAGRAQVLLQDSTACTRGNLFICSPTDGRALAIANPGSGLPAVETHFKEIGHCTESVTAGTNKLAWAVVHFN